jgi:hypothetical protein
MYHSIDEVLWEIEMNWHNDQMPMDGPMVKATFDRPPAPEPSWLSKHWPEVLGLAWGLGIIAVAVISVVG